MTTMRRDIIENTRGLSVQSRASASNGAATSSPLDNLFLTMKFNNIILPWWSAARDRQLRNFWKEGDHLSGAMFAMESKMVTIPFHVEPKDMSLKTHIKQADRMTQYLMEAAEYGQGWGFFFGKNVKDLLSQDNGRFAEIIGRGNINGPIVGPPITIEALDAQHCQRTNDPEFPVIYQDPGGKKHQMHYTRVMFDSQMPSPQESMHGVGFSAVSRAIHNSQHLMDMDMFKEEKLGSRPLRGFIKVGGGLDPGAVEKALQAAQSMMGAKGFQRYSMLPIIGGNDIESPEIEIISLSDIPDGFDVQTSVTLSMAAIALAFGVDARELWPSSAAGASRADALLSHIKSRGKGPGYILQATERLFNAKFLPGHLRMVFDFQDDAQDRQAAETKQIRSRTRERNIKEGTTTIRVERQKMLEDMDIDLAQFVEMELDDGRLEDGKSSLTLFFNDDPVITEMLNIGIENPTLTSKNEPDSMLDKIESQKAVVYEMISNSDDGSLERAGRGSISALNALQQLYQEKKEEELLVEQQEMAMKVEEDKFGDNNPTGTQADIKPSSSEASVSPDMAMDEDDKKMINRFIKALKRLLRR